MASAARRHGGVSAGGMSRRLDNGVGDGMATAWIKQERVVWRRPLDGVGRRRSGGLHGHAGAVGWRGHGATIGVVERWGGEGVATATGRRRAGVDVATGWRRRRGRCGDGTASVMASASRPWFWRAGSVGGIRVGGMTVPAVWWCAMALGQCLWHAGVDGRWPGDACGGLSACARRRWQHGGDIGDMVVLTAFGALDMPRSECCAAVYDPVVCESLNLRLTPWSFSSVARRRRGKAGGRVRRRRARGGPSPSRASSQFEIKGPCNRTVPPGAPPPARARHLPRRSLRRRRSSGRCSRAETRAT